MRGRSLHSHSRKPAQPVADVRAGVHGAELEELRLASRHFRPVPVSRCSRGAKVVTNPNETGGRRCGWVR